MRIQILILGFDGLIDPSTVILTFYWDMLAKILQHS